MSRAGRRTPGLIPAIAGEQDALVVRRAEPCLADRRLPRLEGATLVYKHADMADLDAEAGGGEGRAAHLHRHRRRVQHGRRPRAAAGDRRAREAAQRVRSSSTIPTAPASWASTAAARPSISASKARSTSSPARSGKALGGAAGGYVAGSKTLIEYLSQVSRPQLFSNALPATIAASAGKAIEILEREPAARGAPARDHASVARGA